MAKKKSTRSKKSRKVKQQDKTQNVVLYCIVIVILTAIALKSGRISVQESGTGRSDTASSNITVSDAEFQVHVMDVGQGDSILVLADGHAMLIDTSEAKAAPKIISYLEAQNVTQLDYAAATHLHADHIGGYPKVLEAIPVSHVIESPCKDSLLPTTKTYECYLDAVEASGADYSIMYAGDRFQLGGAVVDVIAPVSEDANDLNNTSLVLRVTYDDVVCIFTGDMEEAEEATLLAQGYNLKADFLKVGHHGSRTSSGEDFLGMVQPEYAAISCGVDNSYGHPAPETLEKLAAYTHRIYVTAEVGDIVFLYDADTGAQRIVTGAGEE